MLSELHLSGEDGGEDVGQANFCAKLAGKKSVGMALDRWLCRWIRGLVACGITCTILATVFRSSLPAKIAQGLSYLLLAVPIGLCLRASVVQSLLKMSGVIYYLLSINAGRIIYVFIYSRNFWTVDGEVDALRAAAESLNNFATAMLYMVILAWQDAVPPRVCPQRLRVFIFAFVAVYKSGVHACIAALCLNVPIDSLPALPSEPPSHTYSSVSEISSAQLTSMPPTMFLSSGRSCR